MSRTMLSQHFSQEECECRCGCGRCNPDPRLLEAMEAVREAIGPYVPNSVCRCPAHDAAVGGHGPDHIDGTAADIPTPDSRTRFLAIKAALDAGVTRIGYGWDYIHISVNLILDQQVFFHDGVQCA